MRAARGFVAGELTVRLGHGPRGQLQTHWLGRGLQCERLDAGAAIRGQQQAYTPQAIEMLQRRDL